LVGTIQLLTNESVSSSISWGFTLPTDFSDAVTTAEGYFTDSEGYFTEAASYLSFGDYGDAAYYDLDGVNVATVGGLEELLLGAAVSF
jgi:hypothetical protein